MDDSSRSRKKVSICGGGGHRILPDFPVAMVGVDFSEWLVALSDDELNRTLEEALSTEEDGIIDPSGLGDGKNLGGNDLLAKAFDAIPVHALLIANGRVVDASSNNEVGT